MVLKTNKKSINYSSKPNHRISSIRFLKLMLMVLNLFIMLQDMDIY